jgi:hypothetical protein
MQALEQHMFEWATPRLVSYQLEHHTYSPIEKDILLSVFRDNFQQNK